MQKYQKAFFVVAFAVLASLLIAMPAWIGQLNLSQYHGRPLHRPAPAFELTSFEGEPVRLEDFRGRFVFLFFGYGSCGTICPRTFGSLAKLEAAGDLTGVDLAIVFVSIDPRRDTQARSVFAQLFESTKLSFVALRGGKDPVRKVASDYGVFYETGGVLNEDRDRAIQHPMIAYIIDPSGQLRLMYSSDIVSQEVLEDLHALKSDFASLAGAMIEQE